MNHMQDNSPKSIIDLGAMSAGQWQVSRRGLGRLSIAIGVWSAGFVVSPRVCAPVLWTFGWLEPSGP